MSIPIFSNPTFNLIISFNPSLLGKSCVYWLGHIPHLDSSALPLLGLPSRYGATMPGLLPKSMAEKGVFPLLFHQNHQSHFK